MKLTKKDIIFIIISVLILIVAVIYVVTGARFVEYETTNYEFSIPVTYQEHGELKSKTVTYCCNYWESNEAFNGYFEDSGMPDIVNIVEDDGDMGWWLELFIEPGYLMGDSEYKDYYADGMPKPTIGYFDENWNEHNGVTEAEIYGIKLIGCEYPEPIENKLIDKGIKLNHLHIGVLTILTFVILILGAILVKKDEGVIYQGCDRAALVLNWLVGVFALPLMFLLGDEWELVVGQSVDGTLAALMAPMTVLGICASMILRRKGKSRMGMVAQFVGPMIFAYLIFINVLIFFEAYLLFLIAGIAIGIIIAVRAKKSEEFVPTVLDNLSLVINIVLIPVYVILSVFMMFMAMITKTHYDAGPILEFFARMLSFVIAAAPIYCGVALGMSVYLRRKGRRLAGFLIQFGGFIGILLLILIDMIPWISITIN